MWIPHTQLQISKTVHQRQSRHPLQTLQISFAVFPLYSIYWIGKFLACQSCWLLLRLGLTSLHLIVSKAAIFDSTADNFFPCVSAGLLPLSFTNTLFCCPSPHGAWYQTELAGRI